MADVNPKKIRFAKNGMVSMAPTSDTLVLPITVGDGTTAPTGYKALGYVDESGVTLTPSIETDPVPVWQSAAPALYNVKSAAFQVKATLMETSKLTTELFFGATWVALEDNQGQPTGVYRLDLSSTPELVEFSLVVDWIESGKHYRNVIPRAMISDRGAITLQRTESKKYELTIDAMDAAGSLGYVLTDDDMLDTGSSGGGSQGLLGEGVGEEA
ncbi:phage tail tube protein [Streptomyces decoyicus]